MLATIIHLRHNQGDFVRDLTLTCIGNTVCKLKGIAMDNLLRNLMSCNQVEGAVKSGADLHLPANIPTQLSTWS